MMRILILWFIAILDFSFAFALTLTLLDFDILQALKSMLFAAPTASDAFTTRAGDVTFLALLRLFVVPTVVMWRAKRAEREKRLAQSIAAKETEPADDAGQLDVDVDSDDKKPLLSNTTRQFTIDAIRQIDFDRILSRHSRSLHAVNRIVIAVVFVFLTTCLIFTGVKVVLFQFDLSALSLCSLSGQRHVARRRLHDLGALACSRHHRRG
jgi:uncharacterized membrane protein (DUF485 family)